MTVLSSENARPCLRNNLLPALRKHRVAFTLLGALLMTAPAALAADSGFDRTLQVKGPVLLGIDTDSGDIHVSAGPVSTVHIIAHLHGNTGWMGGSASQAELDQIAKKPPITQAGNIISIGQNFHPKNISISYEIVTPRGTDLRANTGSGNIDVEQTGGPVQLRSGSGDVKGTGLSDHVSLETGSGQIVGDMMSALDVKAQTGSGDIRLTNVACGLWAQTGSGSITVSGRPAGTWKAGTGSGDITLNTAGASMSLDATTGSGSIGTNGNTFKASPGSTKDHVQGVVNGGGVRVRLNTGSGSIAVR